MSKKRPRWDIRRGRHRKHASRETQNWNRTQLIPLRPPWMEEKAYLELVRLRNDLELRP